MFIDVGDAVLLALPAGIGGKMYVDLFRIR